MRGCVGSVLRPARITLQLHRQSAVGASVIDLTPSRQPIRARVDYRQPDYVAWLYVMNCEDRPDLVKVGLSVDPIARAFGVRRTRKRGMVLPIVEYGKQVSNAVELERKIHELLKRYRVRGRREWFRCSVQLQLIQFSWSLLLQASRALPKRGMNGLRNKRKQW
jgi:hypothetical protein